MAAAPLLSCGAPALQRAWYIPFCVVQCQQLLAQKCQPAFNTIRAAFDLGPKERAVYLRQPVRAASQPHNLYHLAKSTLVFLLDAHNSVGKTIWWVLLRVLCLRKAVPQDTASLQCWDLEHFILSTVAIHSSRGSLCNTMATRAAPASHPGW